MHAQRAAFFYFFLCEIIFIALIVVAICNLAQDMETIYKRKIWRLYIHGL